VRVLGRLLLALFLAGLIAFILSMIGSVLSAFYAPSVLRLAGEWTCPAGTRAEVLVEKTAFSASTRKGEIVHLECLDAAGKPTRYDDARTGRVLYAMFFVPAFAVVFAVCALLLLRKPKEPQLTRRSSLPMPKD